MQYLDMNSRTHELVARAIGRGFGGLVELAEKKEKRSDW